MNLDRRTQILLGVLGGVVVLAAIFLLFFNGSGADEPQVSRPVPGAVAESQAPDPTSTDGGFPLDGEPVRVPGTSARDPFEPLTESTPATGSGSSGTSGGGSSSSGDKAASSDGAKPATSPTPKPTATKRPSGGDDPAPRPTKGPTAPTPVDDPKGSGTEENPKVRLVSVTGDLAVVRINGQRERLDLGSAGSAKVVYLSPLGSTCAWITQEGAADRYTICEGETVVL